MGRIDPAGLDALVQAVGGFGIDTILVQNQAAKRRLDVSAGTAKTIVEIEVAKRCIDVVPPQQADRTATEPYAFGITRRTGNHALDISVLIDFLRRLFGWGGFAVGRGAVGRLRQRRGTQRRRRRSNEEGRSTNPPGNAKLAKTHDFRLRLEPDDAKCAIRWPAN